MDEKEKKNRREYVAFISYRHKDLDKYVAKKVHTLVERYIVPKELRTEASEQTVQDGKAVIGKKLGLVFRDEEELPVSSNLTESIQTALDNSRFLIVICTPNTKESVWVEREIAYFLEKHDRAHVIGVLVDGTPDESFPKLLTTVYDKDGTTPIGEVEPLAANLTDNAHHFDKRRIKKEAVRLYAALIGCPFDSLWQREKRYKMRCAMAFMALGMTIALAFSLSIYLKNLQISAKNQQIEAQNEQIQQQNTEITAQYDEIQEKNSELRRSEAETLIREGELLYERGEVAGAASRAVLAVSSAEGMADYAADAEYLLNRALGAGQYDNVMRTVDVLEQEREIRDMLVTKDGSRVFTLDDRGFVRCFSVKSGAQIWMGDSLSKSYHSYVADRPRMTELTEEGLLIVCNEDHVTALQLGDGSTVWSFAPAESEGTDFACFSQDGSRLALIASDGLFTAESKLVILHTKDGTVDREISLTELFEGHAVRANGRVNGVFSEDGRYLAGMLYENTNFVVSEAWDVFLVDLLEGTAKILHREEITSKYFSVKPFVIGMVVHPEAESVLALHYDLDAESVRMDEVFWDGTVKEQSLVPLTMPTREINGPYHSTFVPGKENGALLASCGEMSLIYRMSDGYLISDKKYSTASILVQSWLDEAHYTRSMLTDDGLQYAFYESEGYSIASFTDRIHLVKLVISEDYALNRGEFGLVLDPAAVAMLICDDDGGKAYLQRPAKDKNIACTDWFGQGDLPRNTSDFMLEDLGDGSIAAVLREEGNMQVLYVRAESMEKLERYDLTESDFEKTDGVHSSHLTGGLFWQDHRHLTLMQSKTNPGYYDLKEKKYQEVFEGEKVCGSDAERLSDGRVWHGAVGYLNSTDTEDYRGQLLLRMQDGEVQRIGNGTGKYWITPERWGRDSFVRLGQNGYVILGQFATDAVKDSEGEFCMDSFYCLGAGGEGGIELKDECPGTLGRVLAVGKAEPVFATADQDGYLRIYDIREQGVRMKVTLPVSASEVQNILFCKGDQAIAVWTLDRELYLYDTERGSLLLTETFEKETAAASFEISIDCTEDPARDRLYFRTSRNAVICINSKYWKKTADFSGMDLFCTETNKIYRVKNAGLTFQEEDNGLLCCPAYTLAELIELTKE